MLYMDLLGTLNGANDLNVFATHFLSLINASKIEERESSNYVDGRYFRGWIDDISFVVSLADFDGNEDLPFWIQIRSDASEIDELIFLLEKKILNSTGSANFQFARMSNFGTNNEQRFDYQKQYVGKNI